MGDAATVRVARNRQLGTVLLLSLCQALAITTATMLIVVSALAARPLAPDPKLATLPMALMFVGTMATTIPASLLMKQIGRRAGFSIGAVIGVVAALVGLAGLLLESFVILVAAGLIQGLYNAVWQYYRFAAADAVDEYYKSRAISYVMAGGILAAFLGPTLAQSSETLIAGTRFAGGYAVMAGLSLLTLVLIQFVRIPPPGEMERNESGRPIGEIVRLPTFSIAVLAAMVGYGSMSFLMNATPLAMEHHHHAFEATAEVIRWHVLGMFVPSFFTGHLIRYFGTVRIILTGTAIMFATAAIIFSGTGYIEFWSALLLLGIGWNFMFIGGTALLTEIYTVTEKAKVQALNDFLVFGTNAASSLMAGIVHASMGWQNMPYIVIPPLLIVFATAYWLRLKRRAKGTGKIA